MGILARRFYVLYKKGKTTIAQEQEQQILDKASEMIEAKAKKIIEIMDGKNRNLANEDGKIFERLDQQEKTLKTLTKGILSIQGRQFKEECKQAIEQTEPITLEQFSHIQNEHEVYNSLGGNHEGDMLYKLVEQKYLSQIQVS